MKLHSPHRFSRLFLCVFLLSGFLFISGCGQFQEVEITEISGVKILKITEKGVDMEIGMKIKNPNGYAFTVFPSSFDIKLSGTDLGTANLQQSEKVNANSEDVHTFRISTTFDKLMEGGLASLLAIFGKNHSEIEIKGNLKVGRFIFRKSIPIDRKQKTNLDNQAGGSLFDMFKK
jgi:LEA14-like dessication related protein